MRACMHSTTASCPGFRHRIKDTLVFHACKAFINACVLSRVAALYLVERIKAEVVSMAATHFQALAVGQARQRAIRRLARNPPGFSKSLNVRLRLPSCGNFNDNVSENPWMMRIAGC